MTQTCKVYKTHGRSKAIAEWLYYINPLTNKPAFARLDDVEYLTGAAYCSCCAECKAAIEKSVAEHGQE